MQYYKLYYDIKGYVPPATQWARKFKEVQAKKLVKSIKKNREITFLVVSNFFPV